jgi:predicted transcriptional regulator
MNKMIVVGLLSSLAILIFEVLPVDDTVNNIITIAVPNADDSTTTTTKISSSPLPQLSPPRIEAMKSPYDIIVLYGMRDSHNIAVRVGSTSNVSVIYYNNRRMNNTTDTSGSSNNSKKKFHMVSTAAIISAISNEKALSLFKAIAHENNKNDTRILMTKSRLSYMQYYLNIEKLMHAGLIRRIKGGNYSLTTFGRVVFSTLTRFDLAIKCYWELKAVDSIITSAEINELSIQECHMMIDKMIHDQEIKAMLLSDNKDEETK